MQFRSWHKGVRQQWWWSETKRTIVFSRTQFEGKADWRWKRRQRGKFWQEKSDCASIKVVQNPWCSFWHLPMFQIASLKTNVYTATNVTSDMSKQKREPARLSASEIPSDVILEGLYKSKLQDSVLLQSVLALHDQETVRNNGPKIIYDWGQL